MLAGIRLHTAARHGASLRSGARCAQMRTRSVVSLRLLLLHFSTMMVTLLLLDVTQRWTSGLRTARRHCGQQWRAKQRDNHRDRYETHQSFENYTHKLRGKSNLASTQSARRRCSGRVQEAPALVHKNTSNSVIFLALARIDCCLQARVKRTRIIDGGEYNRSAPKMFLRGHQVS